MHDVDPLDRLISGIRTAGAVSRPAVERAAGLHLHTADEDTYFSSYAADTQGNDVVRLHLDLREPRPHSGATGGPLLVVDVAGSCVDRATVESRYGPLQLSQVPHGQSADEQSYWSRSEPWGKLSFGFAERRPDCVATVTFEAKPGAHLR